MLKYLLLSLLGLAALPNKVTAQDVYPYYSFPNYGDLHRRLPNGKELPDTSSTNSNKPTYAYSDIVEYTTHPTPPLEYTHVFLNDLTQSVAKGKTGKQALLRQFNTPATRFVTANGDSVWDYKNYMLQVYFSGKDTLATKVKSYNYHGNIAMKLDAQNQISTYDMPNLAHFNVQKKWDGTAYTYTIEVSIFDYTEKKLKEKDAIKGVTLHLPQWKTISFPEQTVLFSEYPSQIPDLSCNALWARIETTPDQLALLAQMKVERITIGTQSENIPADEADYLYEYMRVLQKIR